MTEVLAKILMAIIFLGGAIVVISTFVFGVILWTYILLYGSDKIIDKLRELKP